MRREFKALSTVGMVVLPGALALATLAMEGAHALLWIAVLVGAGLAYGSLSPILVARRALFLGGALPHSALLAAVAGVVLECRTGLSSAMVSMVASSSLSIAVGLALSRTRHPDKVVAGFVGATSSLSVIALYYAMFYGPSVAQATTLLVGDPLLAGRREAVASIALGVLALGVSAVTLRENIAIGVSREQAVLCGLRVGVYDIVFYGVLGAVTAGLIESVGFILTHVLLLMPGSISTSLSTGVYKPFFTSIAYSLTAVTLALLLGLLANISPNGLAGLILAGTYVTLAATRRV
uniref:Metal ABC transporter permease n=1 Tax=Fervidicoccus fontis TaxID=683846 RepID=A0A7J3ZKJ0_9CREN